jgi:hypothetical protein
MKKHDDDEEAREEEEEEEERGTMRSFFLPGRRSGQMDR